MDPTTEISVYRPKPTDLPAFLVFACAQLEAPFHPRVQLETVEEYASKSAADDKSKKSTRDKTPHAGQTSVARCSGERESPPATRQGADEDEVAFCVRCDPLGVPVELLFQRSTRLPRLLVKIIGLCIPYHKRLTRITVRRVPFDGTVLHEIAKFLPLSNVTEICLDGSPVSHRNYHLLLERQTHLQNLSLARCDLTDEDCALLAARLVFPLPASRRLAVLSLEVNRITDEGARALGEALRTNRCLRHLNLAGNAIGNRGAAHILRSLTQFSVSRDEILTKRKRTFDRLKLKREAYAQCYREMLAQPADLPADGGRPRRRTTVARSRRGSVSTLASVKTSGADALADRAEAMVAEMLGAYSEPLESNELVTQGDSVYCAGNLSLSYLNLGYNELDCTSARRLADVLAYQECARRRVGAGAGLVRVVLEGNALTDSCTASRAAQELLERALGEPEAPLQLKPGRRSERAKFKGN